MLLEHLKHVNLVDVSQRCRCRRYSWTSKINLTLSFNPNFHEWMFYVWINMCTQKWKAALIIKARTRRADKSVPHSTVDLKRLRMRPEVEMHNTCESNAMLLLSIIEIDLWQLMLKALNVYLNAELLAASTNSVVIVLEWTSVLRNYQKLINLFVCYLSAHKFKLWTIYCDCQLPKCASV